MIVIAWAWLVVELMRALERRAMEVAAMASSASTASLEKHLESHFIHTFDVAAAASSGSPVFVFRAKLDPNHLIKAVIPPIHETMDPQTRVQATFQPVLSGIGGSSLLLMLSWSTGEGLALRLAGRVTASQSSPSLRNDWRFSSKETRFLLEHSMVSTCNLAECFNFGVAAL
jgi:hypothetical protein